MDKNIMRNILDAAIHLTDASLEDAKESLRDAIELIDIQLYDSDYEHVQPDHLNTIKTEV